MEVATTQPQAIVTERSLLEQIVDRQADVASRYMPVMSTAQAIGRMRAIDELKNLVLVEGTDYGTIPGTEKPTLYKPGAEKICAFFGYVPSISVVSETEDWAGASYGEPLFYYRYRTTLLKDGQPVGEGEGSCNSWESKYRYRNASRRCPHCGKETIIKGKAEYGGGWLCFAKKGGCGAKFDSGDRTIESQEVGRIANPDFADIINTVQKMGQKRAYIAATLSATGASQWFTQDMEDMAPPEPTVAEIRRDASKVDTGGAPVGTKQAAQNVAERKIAEKSGASSHPTPAPTKQADTRLPVDFKTIMARFAEMKSVIGENRYYAILEQVGGAGCKHSNQLGDMAKFRAAYDAMLAVARNGEAVPA